MQTELSLPALARPYRRWRRVVFGLLNTHGRVGRLIDVALVTLIGASVVAVILETDVRLASRFSSEFTAFEWFSSIVFSVEYVLRIWTCVEDSRYQTGRFPRLRYAVSAMAIIDLIAVLPFFIPLLITLDLRFVRAIRLLRLFRLFKIGRYSESLSSVGRVLVEKKAELSITFFMVIVLVIIASSIMFYAEHDAQPEKFSSIAASMWWGVATLTTVGYGDIYPVTSVGKLIGAIISLLGVGIVAMPAGIIASGFSQAVKREKHKGHGGPRACPRCAFPLELAED